MNLLRTLSGLSFMCIREDCNLFLILLCIVETLFFVVFSCSGVYTLNLCTLFLCVSELCISAFSFSFQINDSNLIIIYGHARNKLHVQDVNQNIQYLSISRKRRESAKIYDQSSHQQSERTSSRVPKEISHNLNSQEKGAETTQQRKRKLEKMRLMK